MCQLGHFWRNLRQPQKNGIMRGRVFKKNENIAIKVYDSFWGVSVLSCRVDPVCSGRQSRRRRSSQLPLTDCPDSQTELSRMPSPRRSKRWLDCHNLYRSQTRRDGRVMQQSSRGNLMTVSSLSSSPAMNPQCHKTWNRSLLKRSKLFRRWILEGAPLMTRPPKSMIWARETIRVYTVPPVVTALAYSPDGSMLAVSGVREVLLYNTANYELKARLVGKARRIESLTYTDRWQRY